MSQCETHGGFPVWAYTPSGTPQVVEYHRKISVGIALTPQVLAIPAKSSDSFRT